MQALKLSVALMVGAAVFAGAVNASAVTRVLPATTGSTQSGTDGQLAQAAAGPSTGGGDNSYISGPPQPPATTPAKPSEPPQNGAAVNAGAFSEPPNSAGPSTQPVSPPAPAAAEVKPAPEKPASSTASAPSQAPTTPTAETAPQPPAKAEEAQTPPAPTAPDTTLKAAVTAVPPKSPDAAVPAAAATPVAPATPVQAATPTPVAPVTPPSATAATTAPADVKKPPKVAKAKPKQDHKPDIIVRNVPQRPVHRVPDDEMVYEQGPVPPLPIGRHRHVIVEADGDDGDYIVVRRYRRVSSCEPRFVPGFWFLHREIHCDY